jgi:acetyl-CoA synthetase
VIGVHDDITGQAIVAFVCMSDTHTDPEITVKGLVQSVRGSIGPFASPKYVLLVKDLPKTRSGKVVRRALRKLWTREDAGDLSTLADISVLESVKMEIEKAQKQVAK